MNKNLELYKKYFIDNEFERLHLFELLRDTYQIKSAIYLGSFVHITPAFFYPKTAFIDSDRRVKQFFEDKEVRQMVIKNKQYREDPEIFVAQQNYEKPLPIEVESFDLLISQYAGFVSQAGKNLLKNNGILLANNSHGDAAMAHVDPEYELIAVVNHTKDTWRISTSDLDSYFTPKKGLHPTKSEIQASMKGIGYTKVANNYIFKKVN